jgi:AraC-like DNA-binding protein
MRGARALCARLATMARTRRSPPTISVRLLQPFHRLLASYALGAHETPLLTPELLERVKQLGPHGRITLERASASLEDAIRRAGDPDLGLKAGRLFDMEDGGVLSYAAGTAPTLREGMAMAARAMRLLTDAVSYRILQKGMRTEVRLESREPLTRAAADFFASALRTHHRRTHAFDVPSLEWTFVHARPLSCTEYERTFGAAPLRFSAAQLGFSFDSAYLDLPLRTADARQHQYVTHQLDGQLADLSAPRAVVRRVRDAIARDLGTGQLAVEQVAQHLRMSPRTLARRLQEEGTSFRGLVSDARKDQALHYLSSTDCAIGEIATLLGFSDVAAFYRAFRRWMRTTPVAFRAQVRSQRPAPMGPS